jgi:hypothetical protein
MKKFISYPDIKQFRNVISNIKHQAQYQGQDENGNAIIDENVKLPRLSYIGTEKQHGSNAGIIYSDLTGIYPQSRSNIISIENDNAGFAFFVESKKEVFEKIHKEIAEKYNIDTTQNYIALYGEWCGPGIQKGMALNQLKEKSLFIFGIKIRPFDENQQSYWLDCKGFKSTENNIYNVYDYKTFEIEIDYNNPGEAQNKMIDMMLEVEKESPTMKEFGISGIGEGIVFSGEFEGKPFRFKVKGEKHSKGSKIKTPKKVDNEKINKINEVAVKVLPTWRLEQMYTDVMDIMNDGVGDVKKTGNFLKAVVNDVLKEDLDIIIDAGLEPKDVNKTISTLARKWLFDKLDEEVGL